MVKPSGPMMLLLPINIALSLVLIWVDAIREAAFALSSCTTSTLAVLIGSVILQQRVRVRVLDRTLLHAVARMLLAAGVAAAAVAFVQPVWSGWTSGLAGRLLSRGSEVFGLLAIGTLTFVVCCWVLRLHEVALLLPSRWRRRMHAAGD